MEGVVLITGPPGKSPCMSVFKTMTWLDSCLNDLKNLTQVNEIYCVVFVKKNELL